MLSNFVEEAKKLVALANKTAELAGGASAFEMFDKIFDLIRGIDDGAQFPAKRPI